MNTKTVAFTGMRKPFGNNNENSIYYSILKDKIKDVVLNLIEKKSANYFISGLAIGSDQLCASVVIELKELKKNYKIQLEAAIPCSNQDRFWTDNYKKNYKEILSLCDIKKYISNKPYTKYCMHIRNRYMVDNSDIIIAIWNGQQGGTAQTVKYARTKKIPIITINPDDILKVG